MFQNAKNVVVVDSTLTEVREGLNGRQILSQSPYVVHGAIHDSGKRYPPSECHPGTREDVIKIALDWVHKPLEENDSQIFWLSGPAGVGKTAIAQSLCQLLKELGRLGGDFFLSRSVSGHSDLHTLFPTLAYQLARAYPEFGLELESVIKTDESILTKNMELQLEQLIVNPMKRVNIKLNVPLVFVVDGLDEAGGERDQILLLRLLDSSFLSHHLPLKIILTSRPEPWIKSAFDNSPLLGSPWSYFLHRTSQTDNDIRTFLNFKFAEIRRTHDVMKSQSNWDTWPPSNIIDDIVDKASGQFIYASTTLRYIEDPNGNPVDRLQWIMKLPSTGNDEYSVSPFLALDNLYQHVLSTSLNIDRTLLILGAVVSLLLPLPSPLYRRLAQYGTSPPSQPENEAIQQRLTKIVETYTSSVPIYQIEQILGIQMGHGFMALRTICSLVDVSSVNDGHGVNFYHKSFQDFLLDSTRSGKYFVDMNKVYSTLTMGAFRLARDYVQSEAMLNRKEISRDLTIIQERWEKWWLCSAASDQDRLLTEIRNINQAAFYQNYAVNIARKLLHPLFNKSYYSGDINLLVLYCSSGNVAELILQEITRRITLAHSFEKYRTAETVFNQCLGRALSL